MRISMLSEFQILHKTNGKYVPLSNEEAKFVSVGDFSFEIGEHTVPFGWEASYGVENNHIFRFETGKGLFFDDYELSDSYDESLDDMGLTKEYITAEFLAAVNRIDEFFVDFKHDGEEFNVGDCVKNNNSSDYKLSLIAVTFVDIESGQSYSVADKVLDNFNNGI